ncbi:MAG TPA: 5-deoxy-glucuronate isomerase [Bryobacteraceae bacterium]|nr:5-deoxy-glucuronate isomerase [Bryobacteraceae bacterium]
MNPDAIVFRKTNAHTGRRISVSPETSAARHLAYGRIILNRAAPQVSFANSDRETALLVLSGAAAVAVDGAPHNLGPYDSIYIPRDSHIDISAASQVDIAEFSSEVSQRYPLKLIPYREVLNDPALRWTAGSAGQTRQVSMLIGNNVQAGRLMLGFTVSDPGNWTSWPPHEHAEMLEEMYVYFEMPAPAFGIQMVYNNTEYPELVTVVRDGDAVLMPSGYHPNVAIPGHRIGYIWAMAAHREREDRRYGVLNVQPAFAARGK